MKTGESATSQGTFDRMVSTRLDIMGPMHGAAPGQGSR
jgi:hypothetical protein